MEHFTKGFEKLRTVGVFGAMGSTFGYYTQKQPSPRETKDSNTRRSNIEYMDELGGDDHSVPRLYPDIEYERNAIRSVSHSFSNVPALESDADAIFGNSAIGEEDDGFIHIEPTTVKPNCNFYYLPFSQSPDLCIRNIQNWLAKKWFLPSDWRASLTILPPEQLYVPFYVFNVKTFTRYAANVLAESKDVASPGRRWEPADGDLSSHYDEIIVCASYSVNQTLVQRLLDESGFSYHSQRRLPTDPRVFEPSNLQGADKEHILSLEVTREEAWERHGRTRINVWEEQKAREDIKHRYDLTNGNSQIRCFQMDTEFVQSESFVILLPVYSAEVQYQNKLHEVAVSGNIGTVVGDRPVGTGSGGKYILDTLKSVGSLVADTVPL